MKEKMDFQRNSQMLKVLGHPTRLKIVVGLIRHGECNVNLIVEELKLPQSTVSQHLGDLKGQGIIESRKEGVKTCYRVVDQRVFDIIKILAK
jgi:ArsR family transcriptional regulator